MEQIYLGTRQPAALRRVRNTPLVLSNAALQRQTRPFKLASTPWGLDSGAAAELAMHGQWHMTPEEYIEAVIRYQEEIGRLMWATPQYWPCDPESLARTGLTVEEHQVRTVMNYQELCDLWGDYYQGEDFPIKPILVGQTAGDLYDCMQEYSNRSMCIYGCCGMPDLLIVEALLPNQDPKSQGYLLEELAKEGYEMHALGATPKFLTRQGKHFASGDSSYWQLGARQQPSCDPATHKNEGDCLDYAAKWRDRVLAKIPWVDHEKRRLKRELKTLEQQLADYESCSTKHAQVYRDRITEIVRLLCPDEPKTEVHPDQLELALSPSTTEGEAA